MIHLKFISTYFLPFLSRLPHSAVVGKGKFSQTVVFPESECLRVCKLGVGLGLETWCGHTSRAGEGSRLETELAK